jgi:hypothetical protein
MLPAETMKTYSHLHAKHMEHLGLRTCEKEDERESRGANNSVETQCGGQLHEKYEGCRQCQPIHYFILLPTEDI